MLNSVKDPVPKELRSHVVYKFTCARCNACYVGETHRHFCTRVHEHLRDKSSHIYKHLEQSEECREACSSECFKIIDQGNSFTIKLREAMHIKWVKPISLNQQIMHVNLSLEI